MFHAAASGRRDLRRPSKMLARGGFRLLIILTSLFLFYVSFPYLYRFGDYVRQTSPFSNQKDVEQRFVASEVELACLNGTPVPGDPLPASPSPPHDEDDISSSPIPNTVHFIFGLKNPLHHPGAGHFDFLNYLSIRSALISLRPKAIYLHYTYLSSPPSPSPDADPLTNPWIARLSNNITLVHDAPDPIAAKNAQYAHMSDTLRLRLLHEHGGIYLDTDVFALRSFSSILRSRHPRDVVLGAEGGNRWGLCNAVVAARANSSFVARWLERYDADDGVVGRVWNYHSVRLPRELADVHPAEVCPLAPDAFFWPTWTWSHVEWMHAPLGRAEAEHWEAEIERNGGSLFENQLAYHAWSQMAWDRYLKWLTPGKVRSMDTRFNLLMRRFLEDDL